MDKPYGGKTNNETLLGFEISCSLKIHEPKYHNFNKSKHDTDREDPEWNLKGVLLSLWSSTVENRFTMLCVPWNTQ